MRQPQILRPQILQPQILQPQMLAVSVSAVMLVACGSTPSTSTPTTKPTVRPAPSHTVPTAPSQAPVIISPNTTNPNAISPNHQAEALLDEESLEELADLLEATDMKMVENKKQDIIRYGDLWDRVRAGYKLNPTPAYNPRIEAQKTWFITRQDYLNRLTARASRYLYHTTKEAERRGIPTELALLPVIESSYDPNATSNANAAGLWQFIPSTGLAYSLSQTSDYDGRRDVIESTRAAYDFLSTLYTQFGSWELALAAYNAGPGRISRAIAANQAQGLPTDFWSLRLPTETMNYVPRFLAVADIVKNPSAYNVYLPAIANQQHFREVSAGVGVNLTDVSKVTGVDYQELMSLNPGLKNGVLSASAPQRIIIPNSVDYNKDKTIQTLGTSNYVASSTQLIGDVPTSGDALAAFAQRGNRPTAIKPIPSTPTLSTPIPSISAQHPTPPIHSANASHTEPPLSAQELAMISNQVRQEQLNKIISTNTSGSVELASLETQQSVLESLGQEKRLSYGTANNTANLEATRGKRSIYRVQPGDTLSNIATRAGVSWRDIAKWNQINPSDTLLAGSSLYLYDAKPISPSTPSASSATKPTSYVVQRGDTLIETANRFGLSVNQLASYNNLNTNDKLLTGQTLWLIPDKTSSSSKSKLDSLATSPSPSSMTTQNYRVRRGDSLIGLSNRYNVPVSTLATLNGISETDGLLYDTIIKLPANINVNINARSDNSSTTSTALASTDDNVSSSYKVQSGDTLIGIANKLGVKAEDIAAINRFNANHLVQRGQTIKVPVSQQAVDRKLNNESILHKIQSGDTLIGIANRYDVSVSDLASANGLSTTSTLIRGKTLTIPAIDGSTSGGGTSGKLGSSSTSSGRPAKTNTASTPTSATETYTVKRGDNLISVARRFETSTQNLAALNGITSNARLQVGQKLIVPMATLSYKVKSGDNLIGLANKYGVSPSELAKMNGLDNNAMLVIGQILTVPNPNK